MPNAFAARRLRWMLLGLVIVPAGWSATARADELLPTDPALVTGQLENGLRYIIRQHATPPGHLSVWLHVDSGSLNETDKQRGLAHYLEHMAFNGSRNFPPGKVVPLFESLGLVFGRHQNAFTSFEQTTYQLDVQVDPQTLEANAGKAMLFMSDVAFGLLLDPKEIEEERAIILNEKRSRSGAQQRAGDYFRERIAPGSLYGVRTPIGTEETIKGAQREDFLDYYTKRYVASNMTVLVVGDADAKVVEGMVKRSFSAGPKAPVPTDEDIRLTPTEGHRGLVFTDPELVDARVGVQRLGRPNPPTTTVERLRAEWVEVIGQSAFARRTVDRVAAGKAQFFSAGARAGDSFGQMRDASLSASAKPDKWREALVDAAAELQRARLHGFTLREIDLVRTQLIADGEQAAKREGTQPARALITSYNGAVTQGEPIMSAAQRLELLKRLLPTITPAEVSKRFGEVFDFSSAVFTLSLPASASAPSEDELARLGAAALMAKPEKEAETAAAGSLMERLPTPAKVVEQSEHAASGVTSAWLENGVRVHHKFVDTRKDNVTVQVVLVGGSVAETAADRGVTEAATAGWIRPATRQLSSAQVRELMTGKKVAVLGGGGGRGPGGGGGGGGGGLPQDTAGMIIAGSPEDLETGLQLAHLILTEPKIESAAFENWRDQQKQRIAGRKTTPAGIAAEAYDAAAYPPGDARFQPLTEAQVDAIALEAAQARQDAIVKSSPIEVTIVGDLPRERAMELAARYFGGLPARPRVNPDYQRDKRTLPHTGKPIEVAREVRTKTDQAIVRVGFFGPDAANVGDSRLMELAARVVTSRMVKAIREEKQLVYSVSASSSPGEVFSGWGTFQAQAPCKPENAGPLVAAIRGLFDEFARSGPTDEELATAKKQIDNTMSEAMKDPAYWVQRVNGSTYRARSLDEIAQGPKAFEGFTAAQVQAAFVKYDKPEMRFSVKVVPIVDGPAAKEGGGGGAGDKPQG